MAKKQPKTIRGMVNKSLTGDGRKPIVTKAKLEKIFREPNHK